MVRGRANPFIVRPSLGIAIALGSSFGGCAAAAPNSGFDGATSISSAPTPEASAVASAPPAPNVEAPEVSSQPLMSQETRGSAPACAFVSIGFDSRALPTSTSQEGYESWVFGQADGIRRAAPKGITPRIYKQPGSGTLHALFDGDTEASVLASCDQTLKGYLPKAPHMPLIGTGSAAHVQTPCRLCQ